MDLDAPTFPSPVMIHNGVEEKQFANGCLFVRTISMKHQNIRLNQKRGKMQALKKNQQKHEKDGSFFDKNLALGAQVRTENDPWAICLAYFS